MSSKMAALRRQSFLFLLFLFFIFFKNTSARKHPHFRLDRDERPSITLSSFGFLKNGILFVNVTDLTIPETQKSRNDTIGFTVDVSKSSGAGSYMEDFQDKCILSSNVDGSLTPEDVKSHDYNIVFFRLDFKKRRIWVERRGEALQKLVIMSNTSVEDFRAKMPQYKRQRRAAPEPLPKKHSLDKADEAPPGDKEATKETDAKKAEKPEAEDKPPVVKQTGLIKDFPMVYKEKTDTFTFSFLIAVTHEEEEGMYDLIFHNCHDSAAGEEESEITMIMDIIEDNDGNYLSAGAMPLPTLYFVLSLVYIIIAIVWNTVLCKSQESVYKMHYLMLVVVFVKSLSCLFHAVNYHFIMKEGIHEEAWAVLYYIAYLTRGALLFVTIILIGSGWAFIKHVLSDREKKLFLIFIPLQILDNIASIIVEESEEGEVRYTVWKEIFILIDLLCCGAILFPVVWSIKHLQEASRANGKEIFSLTKLKLFRQFYIMVVCYIYFTRIIVYLLKLTVPFKYEWLDELFKELATMTFFVITGYKFRPHTDNPYLQVPSDDEEEDMEMDEVIVGQTSKMDTLKKVNQANKTDSTSSTVKLRENSHEYD